MKKLLKKQKHIKMILFLLCAVGAILFYEFVEKDSPNIPLPTGQLAVHFIDVGQGDATLIMAQEGVVLIDAGDEETEDDLLNYLEMIGVKKIDILIATHPHRDHIGGMDGVLKRFPVETFMMPKVTHTSRAFERMINAVKEQNLGIEVLEAGDRFIWNEAVFDCFSPEAGKSYDSLNDYSAVLKMTFGKTSFLFTGDAEKYAEDKMLEQSFPLQSDVYSVGHHGSSTSSSRKFLEAVNPRVAVISYGNNNEYGHPHDEVIARLQKLNTEILRIGDLGTVTIITDGNEIFIQE